MKINISVREMIEFACRTGSIDNAISQSYVMERAVEGTIVHKQVQKFRQEDALKNNYIYNSELNLSLVFETKEHFVNLQGRADGLIVNDNEIIIEELKSTRKRLEEITEQSLNKLHKLQMEIYGYIYCMTNGLTDISLALTYIEVETMEEKTFHYIKTQDELFEITKSVVDEFCKFLELQELVLNERNDTVMKVEFPHTSYRKNQRDLMKSVYFAINEENNIFIEAPTGTGKTISTLFPTLKALGEGKVDKIFYVTAKTITRQEGKKSLLLLQDKGLKMRSVVLTAKDKICFLDEANCNPEGCPYALDHFDRVNPALLDIVRNETVIDKEVVERYAKKHRVCPYEFSLDVSNFCDVIIGDYNYVYSQSSKLIRYFTEGGNFVVLVDEAHNLYDRAIDMFSTSISTKTLEELYAISKGSKVSKTTKGILNQLDKYMDLENFKSCEEKEYPKEIINRVRGLQALIKADEELMQNAKVKDIYLEIIDFLRIADLFGTGHTVTVTRVYNNITLKLLCLNPAEYIKAINDTLKCVLFFSATLTPPNYFKEVYGGESTNFYYSIPSPFDYRNSKVLINTNIKTTYKNREFFYGDIAENINAMVSSKVGNYFVFFSSYEYLNNVLAEFKNRYEDVYVLPQKQDMTDEERDFYLEQFEPNPSKTKVGFVVLGGVFGEGIDLVGDRLVGVCVVGVGLPMLTFERDLIKNSFEDEGYDYAYTYPGFNKVMQGVGRLIRTESDKGVVLLLDERYGYKKYKDLYPEHMSRFSYVKNSDDVKGKCLEFWEE